MINSINYKHILENGITIHSSGTSGQPTPYFQTPKKLQAANIVALSSQQITVDSKIYTCCKTTHAGGLLAQTLPALSIGAHVDVVKFNAWEFVRVIKNYTHTHITPLHANAIMLTKGFQNLDLSGIWITIGADPVTPDIVAAFVQRGATVMTNWGMSEIGPISINKVFKTVDDVFNTTIDNATVLGDRFYCNWKIDNGQLVVQGDISIYDDWYYTKDCVFLHNGILYYTGRTNTAIDIWSPKKG